MDAFETHRPHLHAVATRILGSRAEADDALQEAWLRFDRTDTSDVENLGGWLTTVVSRVCLTMLDARKRRREEALEAGRLPDPVITRADDTAPDPEGEALAADAVGAALLVVLETLEPAERLAFVLHDVFAVPFDEVGEIMGKSRNAAKMLASRADRQPRGSCVGSGWTDAQRDRVHDRRRKDPRDQCHRRSRAPRAARHRARERLIAAGRHIHSFLFVIAVTNYRTPFSV